MDVNAYLRNAFSTQFEWLYGRKPNKEQASVYMDFCLGKEKDLNKVLEMCGVDSLIDRVIDRTASKRRFNLIFGFVPDEEQLDVFVSYQLQTIKDLELLWEVNKSRKQTLTVQQSEPIKE